MNMTPIPADQRMQARGVGHICMPPLSQGYGTDGTGKQSPDTEHLQERRTVRVLQTSPTCLSTVRIISDVMRDSHYSGCLMRRVQKKSGAAWGPCRFPLLCRPQRTCFACPRLHRPVHTSEAAFRDRKEPDECRYIRLVRGRWQLMVSQLLTKCSTR